MLNPYDFQDDAKTFVYVPVTSRQPISLGSRDVDSFAFKVALLDASSAMARKVYDRHDGKTHHFLFYDDLRFIKGGSISGRIAQRVSKIKGTDTLRQKADAISAGIRPVRHADLEVLTKRLAKNTYDQLMASLGEPRDGVEQSVRTSQKLFRPRIDGTFYGPIVHILNIEELLCRVGLSRHRLQFYS